MSRTFSYTVPSDADGQKVHYFLRRQGMSSRTVIRAKNMPDGMRLNGRPVRTVDSLIAGQTLTVTLPDDEVRIEGARIPLSIVYEDEAVLVIDKPPFLAVHPSAGKPDPTLANGVVAYFAEKGEPMSFRPLSRLDRNTSGLLLAAKDPHTAYLLSGKIRKEYLAVVTGYLEGEGEIDQPIRVKAGCAITREVGEGGKPSVTRYRSLWTDGRISLVRLMLLTGRTHQIRVHMAWLGHPLAGDTMYGTDKSLPRQALHCAQLIFPHPETKKEMSLTSPLPLDVVDLLQQHGYTKPLIV